MALSEKDALDRARAFVAEDPEPEGRAEIRALVARVESGDEAARLDLLERFAAPLTFGTAGLRGRVEAGLQRMNRVVVARAAWGLGRHLLDVASGTGRDPHRMGVVVAHDARFSSRSFAEETASVLAGLGVRVHVFRDPVPTPLAAFAVGHLGACAGVVVTASHNPPADNGFKVYRHDGSQILSPEDQEIAQAISRAPAYGAMDRPSAFDAVASGLRLAVDDTVVEAYLSGVTSASLRPREATPLRIAYTAMHGVGCRYALRALSRAGFEGVAVEPAQGDPDGSFRTVSFPNPEEPGALDRVLALATETKADLVLANDPDADRLAAAVPVTEGGGYRALTGNELGWLLADEALSRTQTSGKRPLVITTIVSSTLLSRMARDRGAAYAETLTGFKWIADAARRARDRGEMPVFGYEEALGYMCGSLVADKDGISAAVRLAELARALKGEDKTLLERLDEILVAHGMSHQAQWSVTRPGLSGRLELDRAMASLRKEPILHLGASPVIRVADFERGEERDGTGRATPLDFPNADVLAFHAEGGSRLVVRPSGTEPKVKFYLELVTRVGARSEVAAARTRLDGLAQDIRQEVTARLGFA